MDSPGIVYWYILVENIISVYYFTVHGQRRFHLSDKPYELLESPVQYTYTHVTPHICTVTGGPHNNNIAGVAVALGEALRPEFVEYQQQIVRNCKALCAGLIARGYSIFTGGSENHLLLVDLRPLRVDGAAVEHALELCNVSVNKNAIPGEKNVLRPFGLRLGILIVEYS